MTVPSREGFGLEPASPRLPRLGWADNLRVAVIAGVVAAHVGTAYLVDFDWYYMERTTSEVSQIIAGAVAGTGLLFGMGLLFLVAGFFTPASLQRKGAGRFASDRVLRLGVPLVAFVLAIDALTDFMGYRGMGKGDKGFISYYAQWWKEDADLSVMWFVAALLAFSLVYAGWRRLWPAPSREAAPLAWRHLIGVAGAIALTTFLVRLQWPFYSRAVFGLNLWEFPQMGTLFALGALAAERGWLAGSLPDRMRRACAGAALIGVVMFLAILTAINPGDPDPAYTGSLSPQAAVLPVIEAVIAVGTSLWMMEWFRLRWNGTRPLTRSLGRASYAAYVLHPPTVVLLSLAMRPAPVPVEAKFFVVAALGIVSAFAVGWLATRPRLLARIL
jgi:glucan biosynthesis protein C